MFYNKYFKNNYEELITYYPKFYREVLEMKAILESEGKLADDMEDNIERVFNNCFIDTADENTIGNLENFLSIQKHLDKTLEERRQYVKSHFIAVGKISATAIINMIRTYTGSNAEICFEPFDENNNNCLSIALPYPKEAYYEKDIYSLLTKVIPAHIRFQLRLKTSVSSGLYPICSLFPHHDIYPKEKESL
ncbi:MAG: YmfQ family protein [Alistipes sp.]|nr:YmfQ family protein [Alistipes sp.]